MLVTFCFMFKGIEFLNLTDAAVLRLAKAQFISGLDFLPLQVSLDFRSILLRSLMCGLIVRAWLGVISVHADLQGIAIQDEGDAGTGK